MGINNRIGDTLAGLQRAQIEREKQLRGDERLTAENVIRQHAKENDWPAEDLVTVLEALGLIIGTTTKRGRAAR